jgi:excinuclease ABC subunit C
MPNLRSHQGEIEIPQDLRSARRLIRWHCPGTPGVYGMIDADGSLIYVGKSKALSVRLLTHFASSPAESKSRRIVRRTRRLVWEKSPHELVALLRELELIRRWQPRFNVRGDPRRARKGLLCLGRGPASHAYLAAGPSDRDVARFGPFRVGSRTREWVRTVNNCFGLRDCSDRTPILFREQRELFDTERSPRCLRRDLGHCLGPCAAACTRGQYDDRIRAAGDFLCGRNRSILSDLESAMLAAAAEGQYERAAALRDSWQNLCELDDRLTRMRQVRRRFSFVYPLPDFSDADSGETWCLVRRGIVAAATPAPKDPQSAGMCLKALESVYGERRNVEAAEPEDWDALLLVSSWFRRHPRELERTLSPEKGRRLCIDAGSNRGGCTGNGKHCPPTQCPSQRSHGQDSL